MTEEAGMDGAFGLQSGCWLQVDIPINTDSEEVNSWGEIYILRRRY